MGLTEDKLLASYTGDFTYLYPRTDIMNLIIVIIYSGISLAVSFTVFSKFKASLKSRKGLKFKANEFIDKIFESY
jgi:hypothetical protein